MKYLKEKPALLITLAYALFAGLWIYFSDSLLGLFVSEADVLLRISIVKGLAFVLTTSLLLYGLFSTELARRKKVEDEIQRLNADLEKQVEERTCQLEEAYRELEAFTYSMSHDLLSPLRGLDGFSQILLEDYASEIDDTGKEHLNRIRLATRRMDHLINALLKLSRVTQSKMEIQPVNLSDIARHVANNLQITHPQCKVEWVIAPDIIVSADLGLMRILIANLLDNAWKFTSKKAQARIELGKMERNGRVVCFVRDDGVGFDMAYAGKLFGDFQRLHPDSDFEGMGVGLALAWRILKRHGGRIWAEAEMDKGATFYFYL
jgi:light-regulated signal transduction histidine kinase (bacteriophytochrome)